MSGYYDAMHLLSEEPILHFLIALYVHDCTSIVDGKDIIAEEYKALIK